MTGRSFGGVDFGKLFVSIDAMDTEGFLGFIAPDGEFRFASAPPVQGHAAIREAVDGFFSSIAGLSHKLQRLVARTFGVGVDTTGRPTATPWSARFLSLYMHVAGGMAAGVIAGAAWQACSKLWYGFS